MEAHQDACHELGVPSDADIAQIRAAYVGLARRFHPDRGGANSPDPDRMARINAAWTLLSDEHRRSGHDASTARTGATIRDATDTWMPLDADDIEADLADDTPTGARSLPRLVTLIPVSLLAIGVILIMFGLIMKLPPVAATGLVLVVGSGGAFLAIPIVTMAGASRTERDW